MCVKVVLAEDAEPMRKAIRALLSASGVTQNRP